MFSAKTRKAKATSASSVSQAEHPVRTLDGVKQNKTTPRERGRLEQGTRAVQSSAKEASLKAQLATSPSSGLFRWGSSSSGFVSW